MRENADVPWRAWLIVGAVAVVGTAMASPFVFRWIDSWSRYSHAASLEIGAALVGGAVVGGVLLWADARMGRRRREADSDALVARDREQLLLLLRLQRDHRAIDLAGENLSRMRLRRKDFSRGYFVGTNFSGADLTRCSFEAADLSRANLSGATLNGTILTAAILDGADLSGAKIRSPFISRRASFKDTSFRYAVIAGVNIMKSDFTNADFTGATLIDVDFFNPLNLHTATFDGVKVDANTKTKHPLNAAIQNAVVVEYEHPPEDLLEMPGPNERERID